MGVKEIYNKRKKWFLANWDYEFSYWTEFDYDILNQIIYYHQRGKGNNKSWNEAFIMLDTESSRKTTDINEILENHICCWTVSIRAFDMNLCTLWGRKPSECVECLTKINESMVGDVTAIYVHNLGWDWTFLRQFMMDKWGIPIKQLNVNSLRPINIEFLNGIHLRDSLILAQRKLDKWAKDLNVKHLKAVGKWDYDVIRNQSDYEYSSDELEYIEHDTLAGVECLDATAKMLKKNLCHMPYTATGIPREELRNISRKHHGREWFKKQLLTYEQQLLAEDCYHGGFTHNNRFLKNTLIDMIYTNNQTIKCKDFASSYPYVMFLKMCGEQFNRWSSDEESIERILELSENYAFMFTLVASKVELKDRYNPMPYLQYSKCKQTLNAIVDNGRILKCDAVVININSVDLEILADQYNFKWSKCVDIQFSRLDYLPRWFTDYIWKCYTDKCMLKGGDAVLYSIAKAKLNSL